jgi:hypothetical protein|tara:strand:- start:129 stop:1019 length:891 start_codon:yes stop_codon:yes gene_type:complete
MSNIIRKAINESMNQEVDSFDYDSVNVDFATIESDIKKGNYSSLTNALDTLENGKGLVVAKLKNIFPTISRSTKIPKEVLALNMIEDSFIENKISNSEKLGLFNSVLGYWYFDTSGKKSNWISVEKVRFDQLNTTENKKLHTVLDLSDTSGLQTKGTLMLRGIRKFAKGSAFTDVSKWSTLKGSKLLELLDIKRMVLKVALTRSMKDLFSTLEIPLDSKKVSGTRKDFDSIGESAYTSLAKIYNRIAKTDGSDTEKTSAYAPQVLELLQEIMETLDPLLTSRTEKKYKKVWSKNNK